MNWFRFSVLPLALLLLIVVGCGDMARSRVHGKITHQGKPLSDATLIFLTRDKMTYTADLKSDGTYEVSNIPRGTVAVSIQQNLPHVAPRPDPTKRPKAKADVSESKDQDTERNPPASPMAVHPNPLPPIYADPQKSGLTFELKDADQEWSVDLK